MKRLFFGTVALIFGILFWVAFYQGRTGHSPFDSTFLVGIFAYVCAVMSQMLFKMTFGSEER